MILDARLRRIAGGFRPGDAAGRVESHPATPIRLMTKRDLGDPTLDPRPAAAPERGVDFATQFDGEVRHTHPLLIAMRRCMIGQFCEKGNTVDGGVALPHSQRGTLALHGFTSTTVALLGRRVFHSECIDTQVTGSVVRGEREQAAAASR